LAQCYARSKCLRTGFAHAGIELKAGAHQSLIRSTHIV
jgi:hypothetical protein